MGVRVFSVLCFVALLQIGLGCKGGCSCSQPSSLCCGNCYPCSYPPYCGCGYPYPSCGCSYPYPNFGCGSFASCYPLGGSDCGCGCSCYPLSCFCGLPSTCCCPYKLNCGCGLCPKSTVCKTILPPTYSTYCRTR